ncbi:MAG TPA: hypothetical protein DCL83_09310, partial [Arthrobacter bacterium]|nr:hypothetical protein [Arthrobacter sp.]
MAMLLRAPSYGRLCAVSVALGGVATGGAPGLISGRASSPELPLPGADEGTFGPVLPGSIPGAPGGSGAWAGVAGTTGDGGLAGS